MLHKTKHNETPPNSAAAFAGAGDILQSIAALWRWVWNKIKIL